MPEADGLLVVYNARRRLLRVYRRLSEAEIELVAEAPLPYEKCSPQLAVEAVARILKQLREKGLLVVEEEG